MVFLTIIPSIDKGMKIQLRGKKKEERERERERERECLLFLPRCQNDVYMLDLYSN